MRYEKMKRHRSPEAAVRPKPPESTPEPAPPTPPDAGTRPVSPVQRAYCGISDTSETTRIVRRRDASTSRGRRVRRQNRRVRKGALLRIALGIIAALTIFGGIGTLLTHPRFKVKTVTAEGNHSVQKGAILALAGTMRGVNLFLLPTGKIEAAVRKEPTFETVTIHRSLPDSVKIIVKERQPWAAVRTADGACFTIDRSLIPFRRAAVPEQGLPVVSLSRDTTQAGLVLGEIMTAPGAAEVAVCLDWARGNPEFPLRSAAIAADGKLCLNRVGGAQARLGSPLELEKKLAALTLLLQQQPRLRSSEWEYINLYACDAPAVKFKPAALVAANAVNAENGATPPPARGLTGGMEQP